MAILDFEYDGLLLSDFGYIICSFDSSGGIETISNGSNIVFNTLPILRGNKQVLIDNKYEECLSTTIQICKNVCLYDKQEDMIISPEEIATISRWLNRKEFLKFKPLKEGYENIFFEGSFNNINRILFANDVVGLELNFISNRPFAIYETVKKTFRVQSNNQSEIFKDISDEIGFIYPSVEITCNVNCNLTIHNAIENRDTVIKGCTSGEVITMNYPVISSSITSHKIQDDFNYNFFRITNTFNEKGNKITFSHPCTMKIAYNPIRKVGV